MSHSSYKELLKEQMPETLLSSLCKIRSFLRNSDYSGKNSADIFSEIYRYKKWGGISHSGKGSDLVQTASVRNKLTPLLDSYGVTSVLDLPCGDFHWMKMVDLGERDYIGGDIVPELIAKNQETFGAEKFHFMVLNLLEDALPEVDLLLCRD